MQEGRERGFKRRRTPGGADENPGAPAPAPAVTTPEAPPAPRAAEPPPPAPRTPTDLDALRQVAEMDRGELAAMLDAFAPARGAGRVRQGQRVRGTVTRVTPTLAFVGIGGKGDASIDRIELDASVTVGTVIDAYVVSTKDGEVRLSRTIGGDNTRALLDDAVENRIPVQGKVESRNDAGYIVTLSGGVRAFCPTSQIDVTIDADPDAYIGRSLAFRVLDARGRDAFVSHRAIAELEARQAAEQALALVQEGEVHDGTVTTIREFGAFVRLSGGAEGLVRLPNLARKRVSDAASVVQPGQAVRVKVLGVDHARKRLDLGIRQLEEGDAPAPSRGPSREELTTGGTFGTLGALLGGVKVAQKRR